MGKTRNDDRNLKIVSEFRSGKTSGELSKDYHISRQGIHAILTRYCVGADQGGRAVKMKKRQEDVNFCNSLQKIRQEKRESSIQKRYGCTFEFWKKLRAMHPNPQKTPITEFSHNRSYAKRQQALWELTLEDWWNIWEISGHYENRGRSKGGYCMVLKDQNLPYRKDNVEIVEISDYYRDLIHDRMNKA